jgi:hypothetical protein
MSCRILSCGSLVEDCSRNSAGMLCWPKYLLASMPSELYSLSSSLNRFPFSEVLSSSNECDLFSGADDGGTEPERAGCEVAEACLPVEERFGL